MVTIDSGIVFDFPDTWERFTEGSRCVLHTPRREEIIVSASRVSGDGPAAERAQVIERVFANGLEAARRGSSDPELRVTKPLGEESGICPLRCATVLAETAAREAQQRSALAARARVRLLAPRLPLELRAEVPGPSFDHY